VEFEVLTEPIKIWTNYADGRNLLEEMYVSPRKMSFIFQTMAAQTRYEQLRNSSNPLKIVERSFDAQARVFVPSLSRFNHIDAAESKILMDTLQNIKEMPNMVPNIIIYLNTINYHEARTRIINRGRLGEISMDYLLWNDLAVLYDQWLGDKPATEPCFEGTTILRPLPLTSTVIRCDSKESGMPRSKEWAIQEVVSLYKRSLIRNDPHTDTFRMCDADGDPERPPTSN